MRTSLDAHRARLAALLGILAGGVVGIVASLTGAAVAQHVPAPPRAVREATHVPPLLTLPGEPSRLTYEVHCVPAEAEDPEQSCDTSGSVYVRATGGTAFSAVPLEPSTSNGLRQLTGASSRYRSTPRRVRVLRRAPVGGDRRFRDDTVGRCGRAEPISPIGRCGRRVPGLPHVRLDDPW